MLLDINARPFWPNLLAINITAIWPDIFKFYFDLVNICPPLANIWVLSTCLWIQPNSDSQVEKVGSRTMAGPFQTENCFRIQNHSKPFSSTIGMEIRGVNVDGVESTYSQILYFYLNCLNLRYTRRIIIRVRPYKFVDCKWVVLINSGCSLFYTYNHIWRWL